MSISKKSIIGQAELKGEYLDIDTLSQLRQTIREGQQRLEIVNLINKNSKPIINEAINSCVQMNASAKELDTDQIAILSQDLDIIFRFIIYALFTGSDNVLSASDLRKTYLELKDCVDCTAEIIISMKLLTVDHINNVLVKDSLKSDTAQYSSSIAKLEDYFDTVILTLQGVEDNSGNQPNEKCNEIQQESAIANVINSPKKYQLNTWQRGNRMIVFASGCSFLGGIFGQLPGALIGAIAGAIYGSILKLETDSQN
jgi:hypothetical protein